MPRANFLERGIIFNKWIYMKSIKNKYIIYALIFILSLLSIHYFLYDAPSTVGTAVVENNIKRPNSDLIQVNEKSKNTKQTASAPPNESIIDFVEEFLGKELIGSKDYIAIFKKIKEEDNNANRRELMMAFFEVFTPRNGKVTNYTDEEIADIVEKSFDLIRDESTRDMAIRNASGILRDDELSRIFNELDNALTEKQRDDLASQYINMRIMNGRSPVSDDPIYSHFRSQNSSSEVRRRRESIARIFKGDDKKKQIIGSRSEEGSSRPPSKDNFQDYLNWINAEILFMEEGERRGFVTIEFTRLNKPQKRDILIHEPQLIAYIGDHEITSYLNIKYTEYINLIYGNYDFDHENISGNLSLFRVFFRYSNHPVAISYIDNKIKGDIETYPSTEGARQSLRMIRDENIYLPSDGFNINNVITGGNEDEVTEPTKLY